VGAEGKQPMHRQFFIAAAVAVSVASPASAATVIIYEDTMTLDRKVVVWETPGPDRAFLCMLPPSDIGCMKIPIRRGR